MSVTALRVRVIQSRWESDGVVSLTLRSTDGTVLPAWTPGAHVDLVLPSGLVRQYSLCGRPGADEYTVAVLRDPAGRGGSAEIHDAALVGRTIRISAPRNRFELEPAERYVFVAGGIGITPIIAMIRDVAERGLPWELHYGGRRTDTLAFTAELAELAERSGARIYLRNDDVDGRLPLIEIVAAAPDSAMLYACGPAGMLAALAATVECDRPALRLRLERFTAAETPAAAGADAEPAGEQASESFEVELARTGGTIIVSPGQSILDAVREKRPDVLYSCEEGFCGTCETKVLEGRPIHRDSILSATERAKNASMMICVGSCASARLVLDL